MPSSTTSESRRGRDVPVPCFALFDILTEVEANDTECDFFGYTKLLNNLEFHRTLGKVIVAVY
ncbi:unnamed protein product [Fusarium venenatum]|uniref:Uncharacterized protein n=1 Tax=Fusarium venenatum TaxID=56646 RepID=A0A2L2STZ7_9HYPO|nr:uncharacterized protein FVRRES_05268 [Fusarium venenatum]CEI60832.1 unnamed protein product [Fusarium venenatum]